MNRLIEKLGILVYVILAFLGNVMLYLTLSPIVAYIALNEAFCHWKNNR